MAMVKPISNSLDAFDAENSQAFSFTSSGGNQVVKNKIVIYNSLTPSVVAYENTETSYVFSQTVPANTLTNGEYYSFYFVTYDINDNESVASDLVSFYCFTTPSLEITNMPTGNIIGSFDFTFEATYSQTEGERLSFVYFTLYDATGTQIDKSSNIYDSTSQPTTISYYYNGFEETTIYSIQVDGETQYGTTITTGLIEFTTDYYSPTLLVDLDLENKCNDGYVQITSNIIAIDGISNPSPPNYTDTDTTVTVFGDIGEYIYWEQGYTIVTDFLTRLWIKPCTDNEPILVLRNWRNGDSIPDNAVEFNVYLLREIPFGETEPQTCLKMESTQETEKEVILYSNYIGLINNLSEIFIWFKKVDDTYELQLGLLNTIEPNVMEWNTISNVEFNKMTDMKYENDTYPQGIEHVDSIDNYNTFCLTYVETSNGVYDNFDITSDTSLTYIEDTPSWTTETILNCDFNGSINGGNIEGSADEIAQLKIKRRKYGSTDEIILYTIDITESSDLSFSKIDSFCASGETYEYFIVPILSDGTEGSYITNTVDTMFNGIFISDINSVFKLDKGVGYGSRESVQLTGKLQPIGKRYPIIIKNSSVNYEQGSVSGTLLGQTFDDTRTIDRNEVVTQINNFNVFLKDGNAKIIKDWNGNIWLCAITDSISLSYLNSYGMGIANISFNWSEQGQYDTQLDMYDNGLVESES